MFKKSAPVAHKMASDGDRSMCRANWSRPSRGSHRISMDCAACACCTSTRGKSVPPSSTRWPPIPPVVPYLDLSLQHAGAAVAPGYEQTRRAGAAPRAHRRFRAARRARPPVPASSSDSGRNGGACRDTGGLSPRGRAGLGRVLPVSPEEGTPAADLPGRIDPDPVTERLRYLKTIEDEITAQANRAQVGRNVDDSDPSRRGRWFWWWACSGRTAN